MEHKISPVQNIDWEQFVSDMAASETIQCAPIVVFRFWYVSAYPSVWEDFDVETEQIGNLVPSRKIGLEKINLKLELQKEHMNITN